MKSGIRLMAWHNRAGTSEAPHQVHDVVAEFEVSDLPPGATTKARLTVVAPEHWPNLGVGAKFDFWEPSSDGTWAEVVEPLTEYDRSRVTLADT
jgi:hypothetical protein